MTIRRTVAHHCHDVEIDDERRRSIPASRSTSLLRYLGGYFVIDVSSLDDALDWAARAPCAATGSTEVRPVMPPPSAA